MYILNSPVIPTVVIIHVNFECLQDRYVDKTIPLHQRGNTTYIIGGSICRGFSSNPEYQY